MLSDQLDNSDPEYEVVKFEVDTTMYQLHSTFIEKDCNFKSEKNSSIYLVSKNGYSIGVFTITDDLITLGVSSSACRLSVNNLLELALLCKSSQPSPVIKEVINLPLILLAKYNLYVTPEGLVVEDKLKFLQRKYDTVLWIL